MMELLDNFDDIDGPGNNAYLWWDASTEQFTIVPWDLNLCCSVSSELAARDNREGSTPTRCPTACSHPPGWSSPTASTRTTCRTPASSPRVSTPASCPRVADHQGAAARPDRGAFGGGNVLVERFLENADFEQLYQERLDYFRSDLFDSGAADELLDARVATLRERT